MKIFLNFLLSLFFLLPILSCAAPPTRDRELSAVEGKDLTALIEGCGNQLVSGYTYCRKTEGDVAGDSLYFVGPVTNCRREFCIELKVYDNRGELVFGDAIPRKKFRLEVPWEKILKRKTFEISDRGFWPFVYKVYWIDGDGNEVFSVAEGEIRMRVIRKDYIPLHQVENDKNFAWDFSTVHGERVKITTGMRVFVSRRK